MGRMVRGSWSGSGFVVWLWTGLWAGWFRVRGLVVK
jgi:hypothetical protein